MHPRLREVIEPLLRDVRNTSGIWVDVDDVDWSRTPSHPSCVVRFSDGSGRGVEINEHAGHFECLLEVLGILKDEVMEARGDAGIYGKWPPCPVHDGRHALALRERPGEAEPGWWRCPEGGPFVAAVGDLPVTRS